MYYICGLIFYNMVVKKHIRVNSKSIQFGYFVDLALSDLTQQQQSSNFPLIESIIEEQRRINIIETNKTLLELNKEQDDFINKITEFQNYKTY